MDQQRGRRRYSRCVASERSPDPKDAGVVTHILTDRSLLEENEKALRGDPRDEQERTIRHGL